VEESVIGQISVIVPVFNSEQYLSECFDSLINQSYSDFEVIAVNDGSTDNGIHIIEKYVQLDRRFKLVNQSNMGVSAARNTGLNHASGEYVYFLDSDDYINKYAFEKCIKSFSENEEIDVVTFNGLSVFEENEYFRKRKLEDPDYVLKMLRYYNKDEAIPLAQLYSAYEWFKLCFSNFVYRPHNALNMTRKQLIDKKHIRFKEQISYYEDALFQYHVLSEARKIKYLPDQFYYRRIRENSLVTAENNKKIVDDMVVCVDTIASLPDMANQELEDLRKMYIQFINNSIFFYYNKCTVDEKREIVFDKISGIEYACYDRYRDWKKEIEADYKIMLMEIDKII
jgi:glycosyltransferase involved in cell wall biosynthesis